MAFIPMNSGSGGLTETTLWTNPSPTSAMNASTILSLSDDYTNYDFLRIKYRFSTTSAAEWDVIASKDSITTAIANTTTSNRISMCIVGTSTLVRTLSRSDSTTLRDLIVTNTRQWGGSTTSTTTVIPTEIIGMKLS